MFKHVTASVAKTAEQPLHNGWYRSLVDRSRDAISVVQQGRIVFMNPAGMALLGAASPDQVLGRSLSEFIHPECASGTTASIGRALASGLPLPLTECRVLRLDGASLDIELIASPLTDQAAPALQLVLRDVTDRKQLEEQFRQSQKMEAIGQLAGRVAHDFNNMVFVIKGHGDLLVEDPTLTEAQRRGIEQIRLASERATALTGQLLAFSRRQVLQPQTLNVNTILSHIEPMLRTAMGENVELALQLDGAAGTVRVDPGQLEQAIVNLAINARDAMPAGGRLTVATGSIDLDEAAIRAQRLEIKPGSYSRVLVQDTGVGIDPKILARVFEPFFTTKPKGRGTGLGLSTVYGMMKQSGGAVGVASQPGQGTTFTLYLPHVAEPAARQESQPGGPAARGRAETVLVVEDEPGVRDLVCHVLRQLGYAVLEAPDGPEALRVARTSPGPIHLLLSDVMLPQMNGREVAREMSRVRGGIKVLYMSGYADRTLLSLGITAEQGNFLQKPFTPEALARSVRRLLDDSPAPVAVAA